MMKENCCWINHSHSKIIFLMPYTKRHYIKRILFFLANRILYYLYSMTTIEFLRQFRLGGYALFDFAVTFLFIYLIAPLLSKLLLNVRIVMPKHNRLFLAIPLWVLVHILVGSITPLTQNVIDLNWHYGIKIFMIVLIVLGMRGIKIRKNTK